jgi:hypothetical protein
VIISQEEIKIILTNYKTAKIQGEKEIPIEDNENHDLYNALKNYYEIGMYIYKQYKENYPKVYLLGMIDGTPMSGNNFCHYFKKQRYKIWCQLQLVFEAVEYSSYNQPFY